jgi:hypothetical protein
MPLSPARRAGVVIVGAVLGAAIMWSLLAHPASGDRAAEGRGFELRADELSARALVPGSPLACLDALAGESVEAACEKALFASPASVAAASSYVAARLALLASMTSYAGHGDANIDDLVSSLRRPLETDRFGFLTSLHDASRVRANLSAETLDRYLEHYVALWAAAPDGAVADGTLPPSANAPGTHKVVNIDFPTAASIPAVSIMNPEPSGPVLSGVAAAAAANPNPQAAAPSSHRARKQTANPPAPSAVQSASSNSAATEPIWPEPMPPRPPQSSPQTAAAPSAGAPVQLNPSSTAPAGATARPQ